MKRHLVFAGAFLMASTGAVFGSSVFHHCEYSGLKRRVEIAFADSETKAPCSVKYHKDTEDPGQVRVLWTAQNDSTYCQKEGDGFIKKLQGLGWECKQEADKAH